MYEYSVNFLRKRITFTGEQNITKNRYSLQNLNTAQIKKVKSYKYGLSYKRFISIAFRKQCEEKIAGKA